jgi:hypothetical protein
VQALSGLHALTEQRRFALVRAALECFQSRAHSVATLAARASTQHRFVHLIA